MALASPGFQPKAGPALSDQCVAACDLRHIWEQQGAGAERPISVSTQGSGVRAQALSGHPVQTGQRPEAEPAVLDGLWEPTSCRPQPGWEQ